MSKFAQLDGQSIIIESAMDEIVTEGLAQNIIDSFIKAAQAFYQKIIEFIDWVSEKFRNISSVKSSEVIKQISAKTVDIYLNKKNKAIVNKAITEFDGISNKFKQKLDNLFSMLRQSNLDGIQPLLASIGDCAGGLNKVQLELKEVEDGGLVSSPCSDLYALNSIKSEFKNIKDCAEIVNKHSEDVKNMNRGLLGPIQKVITKQRECVSLLIRLYSHDIAVYEKLMTTSS